MARNESAANQALQVQAASMMAERQRWAAVLATPAGRAARKPAAKRGFLARLLGL